MHPFLLGGIIFGITVCLESWYSWRYLRAMRKNYPDLWVHAGRRGLKTDATLFGAWPTVKYLMARRYLERGNKAETAFCESYRPKVVGSYFLSLFGVISFFVAWAIWGVPD